MEQKGLYRIAHRRVAADELHRLEATPGAR